MQRTYVVITLATLSTIMWGSAFPALKISFGVMSIDTTGEMLDFIAYRFLIAGSLIALYIKLLGGSLALNDKREYLKLSIIAMVQVCLQFFFFYTGLRHTTGVAASVINGTGTFFIIIFSQIFIATENVTARKWIGTCVGFAGLVAVTFNPELMSLSFSAAGEGMILLTAVTGALGSLLVKKASVNVSALHINLYQFIIGSLLLLAVSSAIGGEHMDIRGFSISDVFLLLYLAITSALAFSIWYLLIQHNSLSRIAVYFFMVPVWGALFSAIFIEGETLSSMTALGAAMVSSGIYLANRE